MFSVWDPLTNACGTTAGMAALSFRMVLPLLAVVARSVSRISYGIQPGGAEALADQQRIADTFHALKLIPRPVKVADSAWQPTTQQAAR